MPGGQIVLLGAYRRRPMTSPHSLNSRCGLSLDHVDVQKRSASVIAVHRRLDLSTPHDLWFLIFRKQRVLCEVHRILVLG